MHILKNEYLTIESKVEGAELTRIYSEKLNREILWNANPKYWGRHSPVLFPIVGKLKNNSTIIEDNEYSMTQHGFARDFNFNVQYFDDRSISYILTSNDETRKLYPYSFELIIKYTLEKSSVNIEWNVKNTDTKDIYFSIGAHPAFNLPLNEDESIDEYSLTFKSNGPVDQILLDGPYSDIRKPIDKLDNLIISPNLFSNDALIYTNIDSISINSKHRDNYINVNFKDFPLVGIWSPYYKESESIAPFLCIEPWYGLADNVNTNSNFKNKDFINKVSPNESFNTCYVITIND